MAPASFTIQKRAVGVVSELCTAFMRKLLDIAKPKRETNAQHYRHANGLGRRFELTRWAAFVIPTHYFPTLPVSAKVPLAGPSEALAGFLVKQFGFSHFNFKLEHGAG